MKSTQHYDPAFYKMIGEVVAAHKKHGQSFEKGSADKKLRIMVEEVGEIAHAIQDLEDAYNQYDAASQQARDLGYDQLEPGDKRACDLAIDRAHEHLSEEIAQVGSLCLRWLAGAP